MGASLQSHADVVVEVADTKGKFSYFDIMGRNGEYAGSLEAHVAGLVLDVEIHIHSASTNGEVVQVGREGGVVVDILYNAERTHYDNLEPIRS